MSVPTTTNKHYIEAKRVRLPIQGQQLAVLALIVVLAAFFSALSPAFMSDRSIDNIVRSASMFGIVAVGMMLVIITAGIDLSVGSMMALGGAVGAGLLGTAFGAANPLHLPALLAVFIALLVAGVLGLINGLLIARLNLAAFVVTLGMMSVARGLTYVFGNYVVQKTSGTAITFTNPVFDWLGSGFVGPLPSQVVLFVAIALLTAFVLHNTPFGRSIFAVGGNIDYARLSGIHTERVLMAVYAISGVLAGLGGLILTGRLSSASPLLASGYELNVIMIVVIGGTSLAGGRGSMLGTVLGAILISQIDNGMNLLGVPSFNQFLIKGTLLVLAVVVDRFYQGGSLKALRLRTVAVPA
jgi:ribose/xylose/arabinose/galactoside ABC-type transport system permease subunit